MVFKMIRKDKGNKHAICATEGEYIIANGPRGRRVQNDLEAEVELLRRQFQALIEQLRRDRKQQHN